MTRYGWPSDETPASIKRAMCEWRDLGEKVAFPPESFLHRAPDERDVQQLDGRASFEAAVAALGEPDAAHATLADERHQPIGADDLALHRRDARSKVKLDTRPFQELSLLQPSCSASRPSSSDASAASRAAISASQLARPSPVIASASSRCGLRTRQRSGVSGDTRVDLKWQNNSFRFLDAMERLRFRTLEGVTSARVGCCSARTSCKASPKAA